MSIKEENHEEISIPDSGDRNGCRPVGTGSQRGDRDGRNENIDRRAPSPETYRKTFTDKTILLTDDNELNREIFKELVGETGIRIEEAVNGKEAVDMIFNRKEHYYDLVFMDIQMPVMNGYEAAREIRRREKEEKRERLPILALTADAFVEDSDKAAKAGMDGHISKPVNFTQLYETMEHWFGNTKEE